MTKLTERDKRANKGYNKLVNQASDILDNNVDANQADGIAYIIEQAIELGRRIENPEWRRDVNI